ncbi:DIP1984 family protein [Rhodococcus sp. O3]|uniref:DIP1984 family protein n=1 Tax=Rhodococcus sp. O3 TaxID=3404919 RepID=UPI003B6834D7
MKLAEALAARADLFRRITQLRERILDNARHQEGEEPAEDAVALLAELTDALDEYEQLIRRINRTNAASPLGDGTVTDALARRDVLRLHHSAVTAAADAAAGRSERGFGRQLRSELVHVAVLPVAELRTRADRLAREIRTVDMDIQRTNWEVDLLD